VNELSEDAVCWCIGGAFERCYGDKDRVELCKVWELIRNAIGQVWAVWNDAPERTFKEVKELVDKLDV